MITINRKHQISQFVLFIIVFLTICSLRHNYRRRVIQHITTRDEMKHILQWTSRLNEPLKFMGAGSSVFLENKCKYTNCFVTDDRKYLENPTHFHAVVFGGHDVTLLKANQLPKFRGPNQKFIFAATESGDNYPVCKPYLDNFFDWTWTYKLDSDIRFGYITGYTHDGHVIAPKRNKQWPKVQNRSLSDDIKYEIRSKNRTVAWFVSNCKTRSKREDFVARLTHELDKYDLYIDVYGKCGKLLCPRYPSHGSTSCEEMLKREYYFYLSFENSLAEDYVTEKVLIAFNSYTVPIVFGLADYTRFLPPHSYLNALELGPEKLAETIHQLISNRTSYEDYFKWKQYYYYKETTRSDSLCKLCEHLNEFQNEETSRYNNFIDWWNPAAQHC